MADITRIELLADIVNLALLYILDITDIFVHISEILSLYTYRGTFFISASDFPRARFTMSYKNLFLSFFAMDLAGDSDSPIPQVSLQNGDGSCCVFAGSHSFEKVYDIYQRKTYGQATKSTAACKGEKDLFPGHICPL